MERDYILTEDYCSYEVAKLLKEKGFDEPCLSYFWTEENGANVDYCGVPFTNKQLYSGQTLRPTLQMAMKYLREVHDIYVDVSIAVIAKDITKYNVNVYYKKHKDDSMYSGIHLTKECSKYEQACEVGIRYSLENLI